MGATNFSSKDYCKNFIIYIKNLQRNLHRKAVCSSDVALKTQKTSQQEGLGKYVKMLKHIAEGKVQLVS
jgi:hypothetical protein